MRVERGPNIQGPSLIRVPDWIADPLGLYFADPKGRYIRLAVAGESGIALAALHFGEEDPPR